MAFTPTTNIYIGAVPFDPSYRNVRYIPNREAQRQYFASLCPNAIRNGAYTYMRPDNSVVVPFNAEDLYGYNYVMFQNQNYGDRWFYSFVTRIEYVNQESSRLYLQTDIMQTWFPDCTVNACMVEREHVSNDAYGAHIKDEGFDPGDLKCTYYSFDNQNQYLYPVVASAVEPQKDGTYVNVGGDQYQGVYSGCSLTVFLTIEDMQQFFQALAANGQQDAVSALYLVPAFCVQNKTAKDNGWGYWVNRSSSALSEDYSLNVGYGDLDGYVPKNNKTLIYPNQYFEVTNFTGQNQQFRLEFFGTPGVASFDKTGGCSQESTLAYIPKNYNGVSGRSTELAVYMENFPTLTWVYQSFANMWGQNQVSKNLNALQLPVYNNAVDSAQALVTNSLNSQTSLAQNLLSGNLAGAFGGAVSGMANTVNSVIDGTQGHVNAMADLIVKSRTPNTVRGGLNSTTSLVNIGSYTMGFRKYTARAEIAKQIDDYYTRYGYLVAELKVPNVTGRPCWNYVKTNGSAVTGKVPPDALAQINSLFDRGLTFWHVNDVGNFGLDNGLG